MTANLMKGFALSTHCLGGVLFREKPVMCWLESDALGKELGASPIAWHRSIRKGPGGIAESSPSLTIHRMWAGRFASPSSSVL